MNEIKLSEKQIEMLESIQFEKKELEKRTNELNNQSLIVMGLIFDFNGVEMPEKVLYEDGLVKWGEEESTA